MDPAAPPNSLAHRRPRTLYQGGSCLPFLPPLLVFASHPLLHLCLQPATGMWEALTLVELPRQDSSFGGILGHQWSIESPIVSQAVTTAPWIFFV